MVNDRKSCNIRCNHCYVPDYGKRTSKSTLEETIRLQEQGYDVIIAGTETLADPMYLHAYKQAGQDYLLTNGLILLQDPDIFDKLLKAEIKTLQMSAHFEVQEELNSIPIDVVKKAVGLSKNNGFRVRLATTITSVNYEEVHLMSTLAYYMGADEIKFINYLPIGSASANNDLTLDEVQRSKFFDQINQVRDFIDIDQLRILLHGNFGPKPGSKGEVLANENCYCPAGDEIIAINPKGEIYGCPFLMESQNIGTYQNGDLLIHNTLTKDKRQTCIANLL